ncbi:transmembrane protein [Rhynchospora pubera]|uniref:Transmembrane protein n=1 Tax=Rhynchospora pubera TaxID=906938 RepID=A0AAV8FJV9_9POAL|nr:transmembrane protein [Rhynchospora pubera]KAJ4792430.1 transmembrane protein [Rhynchospora pubera]
MNKPFKHSKTPKNLVIVLSILSLLVFLQFIAFQSPYQFPWPLASYAPANETLMVMLRDSVTFLPLKDLRFSDKPTTGHTWFMSSVNDTFEPNDSEYLHFPSNSSKGRMLCLLSHHRYDGAANSYAFAWPNALPHGATLLPGLTYVSETYYDYTNLWHGLSALVPFVGWHMRKGCAVPPARWVLFHWGELRTEMGNWIKSIADLTIGKVNIETFENIDGPVCFEEAVVFRHNQGAIAKMRLREVYGRMKCKAREFCKVDMEKIKSDKEVRMTLLLRTVSRSFKNETTVMRIFEEECAKVENCRFMAVKSENLTFCDQVRVLSETDILATPHGAQMTNMIFMERPGSLMEFYPTGWKEMAGGGQYVFRWLADWAGMRHQGSWWDDGGSACNGTSPKLECFASFKDRQIGHDAAYFSQWANKVILEMKENKRNASVALHSVPAKATRSCQCN